MSVTVTASRVGNAVLLSATSTIDGAEFRWWVDGSLVATTATGSYALSLADDTPVRVDVYDDDTTPDTLPARRIVWFTRGSGDVSRMRLEQSADGGSTWAEIYQVPAASAWAWGVLSPQLTDLATHQWRAVPVDAAGNDGTAATGLTELVLRTPDAPSWTMSYDSGTNRVTFS